MRLSWKKRYKGSSEVRWQRVAIYEYNSPIEICQSRTDDGSWPAARSQLTWALRVVFSLEWHLRQLLRTPSLVVAQVKGPRNGNTRAAKQRGIRGSSLSLSSDPANALTDLPFTYSWSARTHADLRTDDSRRRRRNRDVDRSTLARLHEVRRDVTWRDVVNLTALSRSRRFYLSPPDSESLRATLRLGMERER